MSKRTVGGWELELREAILKKTDRKSIKRELLKRLQNNV
jgi:hypothetical protein